MFHSICSRVTHSVPIIPALALVLLVFLAACDSDDSTTSGDGTPSDDGTTSGDGTPPDDGTTSGNGTAPDDGTTSGDDTPPFHDPKPDPDAPSAPANLRGVAYTETEIEIFWDRADDSADVVAYEIWRDGVLLDTRDGLSYYENQLTPATTYEYNVRALDAEGRLGEVSDLFLTTPEASLTINENNVATVLAFLVSVTNEELFSDFITTARTTVFFSPPSDEPASLGFEYLDTRYLNMGEVRWHDYRCVSNDGMLVSRFSGGIQDNYVDVQFTDCKSLLLEGQQLNGGFSRSWTLIKEAYNPGGSSSYGFSMAITSEEGLNRTLLGGFSLWGGLLSTVEWSGESFEFSAQSFEGATNVTDITLIRESGATKAPDADPWIMSLQASFSVQAPQTGNKPIRVETLEPFVSRIYDGCFESGKLKASGDDGSWLEVDANTGDTNTYKLTIGTGEQSTNSIATWSAETSLKPLWTNEGTVPTATDSQCAGMYVEHHR